MELAEMQSTDAHRTKQMLMPMNSQKHQLQQAMVANCVMQSQKD